MIFGAFQAIFQVGINIRPAKHGVDGMGGGDVHGAMAAAEFQVMVPQMVSSRGATYNQDITGSANYPPEKQTS